MIRSVYLLGKSFRIFLLQLYHWNGLSQDILVLLFAVAAKQKLWNQNNLYRFKHLRPNDVTSVFYSLIHLTQSQSQTPTTKLNLKAPFLAENMHNAQTSYLPRNRLDLHLQGQTCQSLPFCYNSKTVGQKGPILIFVFRLTSTIRPPIYSQTALISICIALNYINI